MNTYIWFIFVCGILVFTLRHSRLFRLSEGHGGGGGGHGGGHGGRGHGGGGHGGGGHKGGYIGSTGGYMGGGAIAVNPLWLDDEYYLVEDPYDYRILWPWW